MAGVKCVRRDCGRAKDGSFERALSGMALGAAAMGAGGVGVRIVGRPVTGEPVPFFVCPATDLSPLTATACVMAGWDWAGWLALPTALGLALFGAGLSFLRGLGFVFVAWLIITSVPRSAPAAVVGVRWAS
jgi:hypothetical protein